MSSRLPELKFFSGRSNESLASNISKANGFNISDVKFVDFANGEMKVKLDESVRGDDVFILQTTCPKNPDKCMMELFILAHTAKRSSAKRVTAVVPYIYGSRQDRKTESRSPITIQLMGQLLKAAGVDRVLTVSLHNQASVAAFGDILVDNLTSSFVFYPAIEHLFKEKKNKIVISPDAGGVPRAKAYANRFGVELGFAYKSRPKENESRVLAFVGDVKNKDVLIVDDIIDTAGTLCSIANQAKERGARNIYVCATHAILSGNALNNISNSFITKLFVTDSIENQDLPDNFEVITLGNFLCNAIKAINADESVGALFERQG